MAPREACRGALAPTYDIPTVEIRAIRKSFFLVFAVLVLAIGAIRHVNFVVEFAGYHVLMISWATVFLLAVIQWLIAFLEYPYTGSPERYRPLKVVVALPVWNEDRATLDRVLYSLAIQTRPPDIVHVVDDGSTKVKYDDIIQHWKRDPVLGERLIWQWQRNAGKKHAQAACFAAHPDADIFVTVDSDTTLAPNAIEEGIKPFAVPDVQSVAGLELAWNQTKNSLTLMTSARTLSWQLLSCAAQNVAGGDVTVNRGTYALYRGDLIRETLPAYLNETFLGRPVKLGDDAALTLFAQRRGKAVQQPTAACLSMYPEDLGHHFRQWTRWMRGSTIRTCWRLRYLDLTSYSWWFTVISTWTFLASIGVTTAIILTWPRSMEYMAASIIAMIVWAILMALRTTTVRRSDQTWVDRLLLVVMAPAAAAWVTLVLRPVRIYGIATFLRQGWVTRSEVEIITAPDEARQPLSWSNTDAFSVPIGIGGRRHGRTSGRLLHAD